MVSSIAGVAAACSRRAFHLGIAVALAGIVAGGSVGAANAQDCASEASLKSPPSSKLVELTFRNTTGEVRKLFWIDQNGERKAYADIPPGTAYKQSSYSQHWWVVTDAQGKCVQTLAAPDVATTVAIADAPAVTPPPHLAQAQVTPPPGASPDATAMQVTDQAQGQPADQAQDQGQDQAQAPDQGAETVDVPQVSPVEQFELDGRFRIAPVATPNEALNSLAAGTVRASRVRSDATSGQWSFEAVPNSPYVRIRNDWKKTYLVDDDGKPEAKNAEPNDELSHWTYEPVDGTSYIQFRNRATERFLMMDDGKPVLAEDYDQDQEKQAFWAVDPAKQGVAAAPVPAVDPAYAAALADCREIGGVWTGASCRAVRIEEPLNCGRGWAWDPDIGECVWDGPQACPPWQVSRDGLCFAELTCRGGRLRPSRHGLTCQCPVGMAAWGNYPHLSCKPSLARILPLFVAAAIAGQHRTGNNHRAGNRPHNGNRQRAGNRPRNGGNRASLNAVNRIPFGQRASLPNTRQGNRQGVRPNRAPNVNRVSTPNVVRTPAGTNATQGGKQTVTQTPAPPPPIVKQLRPATPTPVVKQTNTPAPPPPIVKQVRPGATSPVVKQTNAPPPSPLNRRRTSSPPPPAVKQVQTPAPQNGSAAQQAAQKAAAQKAAAQKAAQQAAAQKAAAQRAAAQKAAAQKAAQQKAAAQRAQAIRAQQQKAAQQAAAQRAAAMKAAQQKAAAQRAAAQKAAAQRAAAQKAAAQKAAAQRAAANKPKPHACAPPRKIVNGVCR